MIKISTLRFIDSAIDFATIFFVHTLLFLSLFSICFIFHLRIKSRGSFHLRNFNSLWTFRLLLVFFIACWVLTELFRLPYLTRRYSYPFLPQLTVPQEANLCKSYLVFSIGFFEPAFLVTLLYLLDVSVQERTQKTIFNVSFVSVLCFPVFLLQFYFVALPGSEIINLPEFFYRSWFVALKDDDVEMILCTYPLISTILFGIFGAAFTTSFLLSFWRVVSHVINKSLRIRIFALGMTVIISLPLQILSMGLSVIWTPDQTAFGALALIVFFSTFMCAVVGVGILVIKPISDSLAAGGGGGGNSHRIIQGQRSSRSPLLED